MSGSGSHTTLQALADELGIHVSTVSRVLHGKPSAQRAAASEETARRIQDLARQRDYSPNVQALSLQKQVSREIGILVPRLSDLVLATVYEGMDEAAQEFGYATFVSNTFDDQDRQLEGGRRALQRRVAGLIITDARIGAKQPLLDMLRQRGVPYVLAYRPHGDHLSVAANDRFGGRLVAEHLLARGHVKIGLLAGPRYAQSAVDRARGFVDYCRRKGVAIPASAILHGPFDPSAGRELSEKLLTEHPDVSAIFAVNDFLAIGVMGLLRDRGLQIGRDIALVGYNDTQIARELPIPLSSVSVPTHEIGRQAVRLLISQIEGRKVSSLSLETSLNVRQSSDFDVARPASVAF